MALEQKIPRIRLLVKPQHGCPMTMVTRGKSRPLVWTLKVPIGRDNRLTRQVKAHHKLLPMRTRSNIIQVFLETCHWKTDHQRWVLVTDKVPLKVKGQAKVQIATSQGSLATCLYHPLHPPLAAHSVALGSRPRVVQARHDNPPGRRVFAMRQALDINQPNLWCLGLMIHPRQIGFLRHLIGILVLLTCHINRIHCRL